MDISAYKPKGSINNKHMLTLADYSVNEIYEIILTAIKLKQKQHAGKKHAYLKNKTLAMIFSKSSTRTRVSFEQGIKQLGGSALVLQQGDIQLGRGETVRDTALVLNRYGIDGIMIRTFKQSDVEELAKYSNCPVINGLTDEYHPCQVLADLMTVYEHFGKLEGLKMAYFGDGNNMAHSLMLGGAKAGMEVAICSPEGYTPNEEIVATAAKSGKVWVTSDPEEAIRDCNVVYTDVFFSMGQDKSPEKVNALMPYQVNEELMAKAAKDAVFMHCLPAHRGEEVSEGVIDGVQSIVFEEAENRLHAQKAVMYLLMKNK